MQALNLVEHNCHDLRLGDRRLLFHIPTTALFDLDEVGSEVLDLFRERGSVSEADVRAKFDGRYSPDDLADTIREFVDLDIVRGGDPQARQYRDLQVEDYPLSTIVLNVNTGCNLGCTYCYKEDLDIPSKGQKMDFETAVKSIELLLREGAGRERINVVFFGGEPLSNLPLIKQVVEYTERRVAEEGVAVDFSMTTNATLLTEEIVNWLDAHRFSIAISMDGPQAIHDRHRLTVGGMGTYDVVSKKARMLLSRYRSRPVGARVTLTHGNTDLQKIHHHLRDELGFFEVGYAPVTSNEIAAFNLDGEELKQVFEQMKLLGDEYLQAAVEGRSTGFSNMHQLMTDLYEGTRKVLPCGAGVGMLAVDKDGGLNLCHRFTGSDMPTYGTVDEGIDKPALGKFLNEAADRSQKGCDSCRIRNICAGGCYHESYAQFGEPTRPTYHYCDILRDWVDYGLSVYSRLIDENPAFFERHITPRRAIQ